MGLFEVIFGIFAVLAVGFYSYRIHHYYIQLPDDKKEGARDLILSALLVGYWFAYLIYGVFLD